MSLSVLASTLGSVAIQHIIDSQVKPALDYVFKTVKRDYKLNVEPLSKHFGDYLKRVYDKHSVLNTLVFHNQQKLLRELYIPLTLIKEDVNGREKRKEIQIDGYPKEVISKYRRILITDTAGMGKSTITRIMFLSAIDIEAGIPFYVDLRSLSKKHTLLEEIRDQLGSLTKEFDDSLMRAFFQTGGFIFFFDGFDEISLDERKDVTEDIKHFIEKAPDNYYIMTSRPEQSLTGFGDFQSMYIRPLTKHEAYTLLGKYDSKGDTSKRLIEKLEDGAYSKISDFLQNPLLVSLLFIGFEYKPEIPLKIHLFYNQVFEAYFNRHDLTKDGAFIREKNSGLDMADFEKVLRAIGYICMTKHQLEFDRNDFRSIIEKAGKLSCINPLDSDAMMDDLLHAVPLFCEDGVNYKWVHKSLQEYFAADFINRDSGNKKELILNKIVESHNLTIYSNLLELYSDLDNKGFNQVFVLPVLDDFIAYMEGPIESKYLIHKELIKKRRVILYYYSKTLCFYRFTRSEEKKDLSDLFKYLRGMVRFHPETVHIINGKHAFVFPRNNLVDKLFIIVRKYPQVQSHFPVWRRKYPQAIECGKLLHITEDYLIENPSDYELINDMTGFGIRYGLNYEASLELRDYIREAIQENEDVFNGLLDVE